MDMWDGSLVVGVRGSRSGVGGFDQGRQLQTIDALEMKLAGRVMQRGGLRTLADNFQLLIAVRITTHTSETEAGAVEAAGRYIVPKNARARSYRSCAHAL